jgi:hypothetical protein
MSASGTRTAVISPNRSSQARCAACAASQVGFHPIPGRALQLRRCRDHTLHPGPGHCPRQPEPGRAGFIGHPHRSPQLMQPAQDFAVLRAQPRPIHPTCFLINSMCNYRKGVHVQPDTRTVNNHRRPPDLQMWLYRASVHPPQATHESFCSTRPSASASLHTRLQAPQVAKPGWGDPRVTLASHGYDRLPVRHALDPSSSGSIPASRTTKSAAQKQFSYKDLGGMN